MLRARIDLTLAGWKELCSERVGVDARRKSASRYPHSELVLMVVHSIVQLSWSERYENHPPDRPDL